MRQHTRRLAWALSFCLFLAACGDNSETPAKPRFSSLVVFGDSLSDVGSYKVGAIAALGGGQFTINSPNFKTNWTEFLAADLGQNPPCAAQTGLDPDSTTAALIAAVAVANHSDCANYAQGGARITAQPGIGNKQTGSGFALTVPVTTQIDNHASAQGDFSGNELVVVMAGANDVFYQAGVYAATVKAGGNAQTAQSAAVQAMITAADNLANLVRDKLVAKGARYVVVMNIPDMGDTPQATADSSKPLLDALVKTFNDELVSKLPDSAQVLNVDVNSASRDEIKNPANYGLTNVTTPACILDNATKNPLSSSLACTPNNLIAGVDANTHYLFADKVHPTPYGHALFALRVEQSLTARSWY